MHMNEQKNEILWWPHAAQAARLKESTKMEMRFN